MIDFREAVRLWEQDRGAGWLALQQSDNEQGPLPWNCAAFEYEDSGGVMGKGTFVYAWYDATGKLVYIGVFKADNEHVHYVFSSGPGFNLLGENNFSLADARLTRHLVAWAPNFGLGLRIEEALLLAVPVEERGRLLNLKFPYAEVNDVAVEAGNLRALALSQKRSLCVTTCILVLTILVLTQLVDVFEVRRGYKSGSPVTLRPVWILQAKSEHPEIFGEDFLSLSDAKLVKVLNINASLLVIMVDGFYYRRVLEPADLHRLESADVWRFPNPLAASNAAAVRSGAVQREKSERHRRFLQTLAKFALSVSIECPPELFERLCGASGLLSMDRDYRYQSVDDSVLATAVDDYYSDKANGLEIAAIERRYRHMRALLIQTLDNWKVLIPLAFPGAFSVGAVSHVEDRLNALQPLMHQSRYDNADPAMFRSISIVESRSYLEYMKYIIFYQYRESRAKFVREFLSIKFLPEKAKTIGSPNQFRHFMTKPMLLMYASLQKPPPLDSRKLHDFHSVIPPPDDGDSDDEGGRKNNVAAGEPRPSVQLPPPPSLESITETDEPEPVDDPKALLDLVRVPLSDFSTMDLMEVDTAFLVTPAMAADAEGVPVAAAADADEAQVAAPVAVEPLVGAVAPDLSQAGPSQRRRSRRDRPPALPPQPISMSFEDMSFVLDNAVEAFSDVLTADNNSA
mmetsp:Transcript_10834/g.35616  ORF Transcript_10834/g.35616 Transcript_10834/m.35616 type:complete len:684 (-) Transcript_10834:1329-3380(-)